MIHSFFLLCYLLLLPDSMESVVYVSNDKLAKVHPQPLALPVLYQGLSDEFNFVDVTQLVRCTGRTFVDTWYQLFLNNDPLEKDHALGVTPLHNIAFLPLDSSSDTSMWWKMKPSDHDQTTFVLENAQGLYLSAMEEYEESKVVLPKKKTFSFRGSKASTKTQAKKIFRRTWRAQVQLELSRAIELHAYCPVSKHNNMIIALNVANTALWLSSHLEFLPLDQPNLSLSFVPRAGVLISLPRGKEDEEEEGKGLFDDNSKSQDDKEKRLFDDNSKSQDDKGSIPEAWDSDQQLESLDLDQITSEDDKEKRLFDDNSTSQDDKGSIPEEWDSEQQLESLDLDQMIDLVSDSSIYSSLSELSFDTSWHKGLTPSMRHWTDQRAQSLKLPLLMNLSQDIVPSSTSEITPDSADLQLSHVDSLVDTSRSST